MTQSILMLIHIATGTIGLIAGVAAVSFNKGSRWHRYAGRVFLVSMLLLFISGSWIAFLRSISLSFANGILASYLVATGWMSVKQPTKTISQFDLIAFVTIVFTCAMLVFFAINAAETDTGKLDGFPAPVFLFFASVAATAAIGDVRMFVKGGISGKARLGRHLWRMFFPFFMATAAVFLGQAKIFPDFMRNIAVLVLPVALVILAMLYWVVKVKFGKPYSNLATN